MVMFDVGSDSHDVVELVKVKLTVPAETPVTTPELDTVAIELLELVHIPPLLGDSVVVSPSHIEASPVTDTSGLDNTSIVAVDIS